MVTISFEQKVVYLLFENKEVLSHLVAFFMIVFKRIYFENANSGNPRYRPTYNSSDKAVVLIYI